MAKQLTYKERQDVLWALDEQAKRLDALTGDEAPQAKISADRLRRLYVKFRNGER